MEDNMLSTLNIGKEVIIKYLIVMSHLLVTMMLCMALKKRHPIKLCVILSFIVGYLSYNEKSSPPYVLPILGFFIFSMKYLVDFLIEKTDSDPKNKMFEQMETKLWEIPFYGIVSYYAYLLMKVIVQKN